MGLQQSDAEALRDHRERSHLDRRPRQRNRAAGIDRERGEIIPHVKALLVLTAADV